MQRKLLLCPFHLWRRFGAGPGRDKLLIPGQESWHPGRPGRGYLGRLALGTMGGRGKKDVRIKGWSLSDGILEGEGWRRDVGWTPWRPSLRT